MKDWKLIINTVAVGGLLTLIAYFPDNPLFTTTADAHDRDHHAGILPYTSDAKGKQSLFLLSKDNEAWGELGSCTYDKRSIPQAAAKGFTEETLFVYGGQDYILPKLTTASPIKHPFQDSFLYLTPVEFQATHKFCNKSQDLMQKYGKMWLREHGALKQNFKWIDECQLLGTLLKTQTKIIKQLEEGRDPDYVLKNVIHHVALQDNKSHMKIDANLVEFLLTPKCQEILKKAVISQAGQKLLDQIIRKSQDLENKLNAAQGEFSYNLYTQQTRTTSPNKPHPKMRKTVL